ncbi:hypothetical protein CHH80_01730 [Bacillus sp. 7504-2]|nr:hypothetical protein CHH80_01730 [Bacillus sp. 7504-2]
MTFQRSLLTNLPAKQALWKSSVFFICPLKGKGGIIFQGKFLQADLGQYFINEILLFAFPNLIP